MQAGPTQIVGAVGVMAICAARFVDAPPMSLLRGKTQLGVRLPRLRITTDKKSDGQQSEYCCCQPTETRLEGFFPGCQIDGATRPAQALRQS